MTNEEKIRLAEKFVRAIDDETWEWIADSLTQENLHTPLQNLTDLRKLFLHD